MSFDRVCELENKLDFQGPKCQEISRTWEQHVVWDLNWGRRCLKECCALTHSQTHTFKDTHKAALLVSSLHFTSTIDVRHSLLLTWIPYKPNVCFHYNSGALLCPPISHVSPQLAPAVCSFGEFSDGSAGASPAVMYLQGFLYLETPSQ